MDKKSNKKNPHYDEYYENNDSTHSCYYKDYNAYWRHEADYGMRKPSDEYGLRRSINERAFESIFGYHGSKWVWLVSICNLVNRLPIETKAFKSYNEAFKWADNYINTHNMTDFEIEEGWLTNGAKSFHGLDV